MSALSDALNRQGLKFLEANNHQRAGEFFQAAIDEDRQLADGYTNLGVTLFMQHRYDEAEHTLRQSLAIRPDHPETLLNLGYVHWRLGQFDAAKAIFHRTIAMGDLPTAYTALGTVYWEIGNREAAEHYCRLGIERLPDDLVGNDTLREIAQYSGDEATALAACDTMIRLFPNHREHAHKKALVRLTYADPLGWAERESRYDYIEGLTERGRQEAEWFVRLFGRRWDGRPTGHLVVATEQGFGDVIQFLRYVPLAAARCERLSLLLPTSLRRIARQSFTASNVVVVDAMPETFDHYCLIMSLAYLLDRTEDIPSPPYLVTSPGKFSDVRRIQKAKVGIKWAGSKGHQNDYWRSMPFEQLLPLFDLPVQFVSLQYPCEISLRPHPVLAVPLTPLAMEGRLQIDWSETAALIDALDLVISVDTAVLHLAGALGKPVWLLNRFNTDWRWRLDRPDTPWYPTMRIFRQPKMGDWASVITKVRHALLNCIDNLHTIE
jgi:tetratricopeptide (TPR) repeat protein